MRAQLDRVVDALGVGDQISALEEGQRAVILSFSRSYLAEALDLVDDPARPGSWSHHDPLLLQAQGSASALVARLIDAAGVANDGDRILDVGTGVGGLAAALATTYPSSAVVGIDPLGARARACARVRSAGLGDRVTVLNATVEEFEDGDGFDRAWLRRSSSRRKSSIARSPGCTSCCGRAGRSSSASARAATTSSRLRSTTSSPSARAARHSPRPRRSRGWSGRASRTLDCWSARGTRHSSLSPPFDPDDASPTETRVARLGSW
ncbi:MAG: methyltransferase domain-containing protein [Gaiellaceae bacterium]